MQNYCINNCHLRFHEFNSSNASKAILILHGWGLSSFPYLELARLLEQKKYRVFLLDIPGFGKSAINNNQWRYEDYADYISKFIEEVIRDKVILIGHSFGGGISITIASKHQSQIERLLLINTSGVPIDLPIVLLVKNKVLETLLQLTMKGGFFPSLKMGISFFQNVIRNPAGMYFSANLTNHLNITEKLKMIRAPISIYWARKDMTIPVEKGEVISSLIKTPISFAPDNLYHDWCITHPKVFINCTDL